MRMWEAKAETGTLWSPWLGYLGPIGECRPSWEDKGVSVQLYDLSPPQSHHGLNGGLDVLARISGSA